MFLGLAPQEREERLILNRVMGVGGHMNAFFIGSPPKRDFSMSRQTRYRINEAGEVEELPGFSVNITAAMQNRANYGNTIKSANESARAFDAKVKDYEFTKVSDAINAASKKTKQSVADLEKQYKDQLSQNMTYNTLAEQIAGITGGVRSPANIGAFNQAVAALGGDRNYAASDLGTRLNFQVSDQQIVDDYNNTRLNRLNIIAEDGAAQIAGIQSRLQAANQLLAGLPANDPRRTSAQVSIDQLNSDLASVQGAVTKANDQIKNYKPVTPDTTDGLREITSFREFVKLPEERASDQLRQIDPEAYETAKGLGQQYRNLVTQELPATTTPQTEQLRQTIEQEALNQLRLGSTLGAEERRGYEQAVRAAQTSRGNIFGLGPAVQEAAQLGAAGEQRKLARYGAAQQFLASGETTGAAAARDLALREGLTQQRLGAASGFLAGGPSLANLAQQRLGQQNLAAQQYIQANQALPGQFQTQGMPQQFYQTANPNAGFIGAQNAAGIYNTMSDYTAQTYGAQVGAIAQGYRSPGQEFAAFAGGASDIMKGFGGLASAGILCWVAREVYGEENPRWLMFREWMLTKASDNLRNYYIKYGEKIAKSIRNKPKIKNIIRNWMDRKIKELYGS